MSAGVGRYPTVYLYAVGSRRSSHRKSPPANPAVSVYSAVMRTSKLRSVSILLLAITTSGLLPGCDNDSPTAPTLPEGPVVPVQLYAAQLSGLETQQRQVIRQEAQFEEVWEEIFVDDPMPLELPTVDFSVNMVLVVASGAQPNGCYSIAIDNASADGTDLTVTVTETGPTPVCMCTLEEVQPVEVVQVPRADEVFFTNINVTTCSS